MGFTSESDILFRAMLAIIRLDGGNAKCGFVLPDVSAIRIGENLCLGDLGGVSNIMLSGN